MKTNQKYAITLLGIFTTIISTIGIAAKEVFSSTLINIFEPLAILIKEYLIPPPDTHISDVIDAQNNSIIDKKITGSRTLTIKFNGTSSYGISHFECSINKLDDDAFSICPNPQTYDELPFQNLNFYVRAVDKLSDSDSSPEKFSIRIQPSPPDTIIKKILNHKNEQINNNNLTTSRTISVIFSGNDNDGVKNYICNFDGEKDNNCESPKTYFNLKDGIHNLIVKSADIDGIEDPTPAKYILHIVSSGYVSGVVHKSGKPYSNVQVVIDDKYKGNASNSGRFVIPEVPNNNNQPHLPKVLDKNSNLEYVGDPFVMLPSDEAIELPPLVVDANLFLLQTASTNLDKNSINKYFVKENYTIEKPIDLVYNADQIENPKQNAGKLWKVVAKIIGPTKILNQINKVTYYLHPTFNPNVITLNNSKDNFVLNMTVYGGFKINAKAYFNDGYIVDLSRFILLSNKK